MNKIIERENISLDMHADNWEEALRLSGQLLVNSGYITEKYVDLTVEAVKKLGPYIVLTHKFALAHSCPDQSVLKTGISLITLDSPVDFKSELGPVDVVMTLAAVDANSHMDKIAAIAELFSNENTIEAIEKAKDPSVIEKMFNKYDSTDNS